MPRVHVAVLVLLGDHVLLAVVHVAQVHLVARPRLRVHLVVRHRLAAHARPVHVAVLVLLGDHVLFAVVHVAQVHLVARPRPRLHLVVRHRLVAHVVPLVVRLRLGVRVQIVVVPCIAVDDRRGLLLTTHACEVDLASSVYYQCNVVALKGIVESVRAHRVPAVLRELKVLL